MKSDPGGGGVEGFLLDLEAALSRHPWMSRWRTQRVVEEVRSHLTDSVATLMETGRSPEQAAHEALTRFGTANATSLALTQINDRWTLMLLKLATGTAVAVTSLMAAAVFVFSALAAPPELRWSNLGVAALILGANLAVFVHLFVQPLTRKPMAWLASGIMLLGLFITAVSSVNAIRGPDPEYWIIMMGLLLVGEAAALLLGLFSSRVRTV